MNLFREPESLTLRPTSLTPGVYTDPEEPAAVGIVVAYEGKNYLVLFGDEKPKAGDIRLENAYVSDYQVNYMDSKEILIEDPENSFASC